MEEVFIAIMEQIAQEMPELSLIDEDYGQLEMGAEEDQYPVTFPCVLIGNTSSDWNDLGYGVSAMHGQRFAAGTREKPLVCHATLHQGL